MTYTPTTWVDNTTVANAAQLNRMEAGIVAASGGGGGTTYDLYADDSQSLPGRDAWGSNVTWLGGVATGLLAANTVTIIPFYCSAARTLSNTYMDVSTAGATGAKARLGIFGYTPNTITVGSLVSDLGQVAVDATGLITVTSSSLTLSAGYYAVLIAASAVFTPMWKVSSSNPFKAQSAAYALENEDRRYVAAQLSLTYPSSSWPGSITGTLAYPIDFLARSGGVPILMDTEKV